VIDLQSHPDGIVLPVWAAAAARRDGIRGEQAGALKVSVVQVAEKGKANQALALVIAKGLSLRKSQVTLLSGTTHAAKRFLVSGISRAELEQRLRTLLST
jgi:hypothetical protein